MKTTAKLIKVIVVDDHDVFRSGLKFILKRFSNIEIIAEACNGEEFIEICRHKTPDIVFMDVKMPVMGGLEATQYCSKYWPEIKIIALTMFKERIYVMNLIEAGAKGILFKESFSNELDQAINTVSKGEVYYSNIVNTVL